MDHRDENEINFSFAGCGFLGIYHVGVASCLHNNARHLIDHCHFSGASAGAMIAACLMCDVCLGDCTTFTISLATEARSHYGLGPLHPNYTISKNLEEALDRVLPHNAHEIVSGRLHVSFTKVMGGSNLIVSHFKTKHELIQALLCSAHVPFYSGFVPKTYNGTRYVDGGLSVNIPIVNEDTVTVSPFAGESDICPNDPDELSPHHIMMANTSFQISFTNLCRMSRALFPLPPEDMQKMCDQGYTDCLIFLQKNNLIRCERHVLFVRGVVNDGILSELEVSAQNSSGVQQSKIKTERQTTENTESVQYANGSESEDDGESESESDSEACPGCKKRNYLALRQNLPKRVMKVLNCAIEKERKNESSFVCRNKYMRYLRRLFCFYSLPMEMTFIYTLRFVKYIPQLPSGLKDFCMEAYNLLKFLVVTLNDYGQFDKHLYRVLSTLLNIGNGTGIPTINETINYKKYQVHDIRKRDRKKQDCKRKKKRKVTKVERTSNGEKILTAKASPSIPAEQNNNFMQTTGVELPVTSSLETRPSTVEPKPSTSDQQAPMVEQETPTVERKPPEVEQRTVEQVPVHNTRYVNSDMTETQSMKCCKSETKPKSFHSHGELCNTQEDQLNILDYDSHDRLVSASTQNDILTWLHYRDEQNLLVFHVRDASHGYTKQNQEKYSAQEKNTVKMCLRVVNEQESAISSYYKAEDKTGMFVFEDAFEVDEDSELARLVNAKDSVSEDETSHRISLEQLMEDNPDIEAEIQEYLRRHTSKVKHNKKEFE